MGFCGHEEIQFSEIWLRMGAMLSCVTICIIFNRLMKILMAKAQDKTIDKLEV